MSFLSQGRIMPKIDSLDDVMSYFDALPTVDNPEFFGMHENANTTFNRKESLSLLKSILDLQPRSSGGGSGKSSDEIVLELADNFLEQTPEILDEEEAGETTFVIQENGLLPSLAIVLQQEIIKFNRLIRRMNSTLQDLKKAIKGFIVMSGPLDEMFGAFLANRLPNLWKTVSFASLKTLGSWVKDMNGRVDFLRDWLHGGQPAAFRLGAVFFPQGLMTGVLQTYARKYQVAIDTLSFRYAVLDCEPEEITEGPEDGIYVYGLFMEGARWDDETRLMAMSRPGEIYTSVPPIHFLPAVDHVTPDDVYAMPVYKTDARRGVLSTTGMSTNFVVAVEMPTDVDPVVFCLAGCAAITGITD